MCQRVESSPGAEQFLAVCLYDADQTVPTDRYMIRVPSNLTTAIHTTAAPTFVIPPLVSLVLA